MDRGGCLIGVGRGGEGVRKGGGRAGVWDSSRLFLIPGYLNPRGVWGFWGRVLVTFYVFHLSVGFLFLWKRGENWKVNGFLGNLLVWGFFVWMGFFSGLQYELDGGDAAVGGRDAIFVRVADERDEVMMSCRE